MKKSEQYWNAACELTEGDFPWEWPALRDMCGLSADEVQAELGSWYDTDTYWRRAFFFFMVAEEHRIHGD